MYGKESKSGRRGKEVNSERLERLYQRIKDEEHKKELSDALEITRRQKLIIVREKGFLEDPSGFLRKRCPRCKTKLKKHEILYDLCFSYYLWTCTHCDYEYAKMQGLIGGGYY